MAVEKNVGEKNVVKESRGRVEVQLLSCMTGCRGSQQEDRKEVSRHVIRGGGRTSLAEGTASAKELEECLEGWGERGGEVRVVGQVTRPLEGFQEPWHLP